MRNLGQILLAFFLVGCTGGGGESVDDFFDAGNGAPGNSAFAFSPETFDFGPLRVSEDTETTSLTATNSYAGPVYLTDVTGGTSQFTVVSDNCPRSPQPLASGAACIVNVAFAPAAPGIHGATVNFTYGVEADSATAFRSTYGITGTGVGDLEFDGLESIAPVTTTRATLNWTHIPEASQYFIFQVAGDGSLSLVDQVDPPTATYLVSGLTPATAYTYRVRATDLLGVLETNTNDVTITTDSLGTFSAIANIAVGEGGSQSTAALGCTDIYGSSAVFTVTAETDSDSNCAVAAGVVTCNPSFKTGHASWFSDVTVQCAMNDSTYARTFRINVSDTNRAPALATINNQTVDTGSGITAVNANDGGDDADVDLDALAYTCTFAGGGFGAGTNCTSLPNNSFSFGAGTGLLNWTPSQAAAVGGVSTVYTLTLTGSDQQGAPLTDSESFTVTVNPAVALTTVADFTPANGSQIAAGNPLPQVDIQNTATGDDTGMTYTCTFDTVVDGAVAAGTACTSLPGTATFTAAGVFNWTPSSTVDGLYEIRVYGAKGGNNDEEIFLVFVHPGYEVANLLAELDAKYATGTGPASNPDASWQDLTSNNLDGGLLAGASGAWAGTGASSDPYRVGFPGTSSLDMGSALSGLSDFSAGLWIKPNSPTTAGAVIFGNGGGGADGMVLEQASGGTGELEFTVGTSPASCQTTTRLQSGVWYHVLPWVDSNQARIYLNGRLECSQSMAGFTLDPSATDLFAGAGSGGANAWDGELASVRLYSTPNGTQGATNFAATANRMRATPLGEVSTSGLVLLWDAANSVAGMAFEGVGCPVLDWFDLSSSANDGTPLNFGGCGALVGWNGVGTPGDPYRLSMDEGDDGIIANPVNNFPTTQVSVEQWVRTSSSGEALFSYAVASHSNHLLLFNQGNLAFYRNSNITSGVSIDDGQWHHVVVTWTSAGGTTLLYVDGAQVYSGTISNGTPLTPGGGFMIGQEQDSVGGGFAANQSFEGDLAYTAVYNRVLTPAEISNHCEAHESRYLGVTCN